MKLGLDNHLLKLNFYKPSYQAFLSAAVITRYPNPLSFLLNNHRGPRRSMCQNFNEYINIHMDKIG